MDGAGDCAREWRWRQGCGCARAESGPRPKAAIAPGGVPSCVRISVTRSTCGCAGRRRTRWQQGCRHGRPTPALGASHSAPRMGRGSWRSRRGRSPAPDASSWNCTGCATPRRREVSSQQAPRLFGRGGAGAGTLLLPKHTAARRAGAHTPFQGTGCAVGDAVQLNQMAGDSCRL